MTRWRKSSRSGGDEASSCVEVAALPELRVGLRDSKDPSGQYLELTPGVWRALLSRVGDGAFDLHQ
jgi:hypothetical protein